MDLQILQNTHILIYPFTHPLKIKGATNMNQIEQAEKYFNEGYACSQSVLAAFCQELDLPKEPALRLADGFGGGIARQGLICGAVSGAIMVLSLKFGQSTPQDKSAKEKLNAKIQQFLEQFQAQHQTITCNDLLGIDISTDQGLKTATKKNLFKTQCPNFVNSATQILTEIL